MTNPNPDVLSDNHARLQATLDMEDEIIKEAFFDFTKGKRNYRGVCLSNYALSDKPDNYATGQRLPVKLKVLDTIEHILPDPCELLWDAEQTKRIVSFYPTAFSSQPYESRYLLPSFGQVVRIHFDQKGPAEHGRHRGVQFSFVASKVGLTYDCENRKFIGGITSFGRGRESNLGKYPKGKFMGKCRKKGTVPTKDEILKAYPAARPVIDEIFSTAKELGIPDPGWLANLINMESSWKPQAVNHACMKKYNNQSKCATGLIQFMPDTAESLGTTVGDLYGMTAKQQWPYVKKFLKNRGTGASKWSNPSDVYMSVFYPKAMGRAETWSIADDFATRMVKKYKKTKGKSGFKSWDAAKAHFLNQNPGIDTKQDYANKANKKSLLPTHWCKD